MARYGQSAYRRRPRRARSAPATSSAVEFVELGLGDVREQRGIAGLGNAAGLHGAGFVSRGAACRGRRSPGSKPPGAGSTGVRRAPGRRPDRRARRMRARRRPVLFVSAHYESHSDPADRVDADPRHARRDRRACAKTPVLIGGDFNTSTFTLAGKRDAGACRGRARGRPEAPRPAGALRTDVRPSAARGYDRSNCNVPLAPTQRTRPDGTPPPPFGKIDWLFRAGSGAPSRGDSGGRWGGRRDLGP